MLNRFTQTLWDNMDDDTSILIVSDHGNCEDIRTGGHTRNMVPAIFLSRDRTHVDAFVKRVKHLYDIYQAILDYFTQCTHNIKD